MKRHLHTIMVRPVLMYGLEATALAKAQERKLEVAEMGILSWSLGLTRKDRVRNDQVRETMRVAPLHEKGKIAVVWACTTKRPDLCGGESGGDMKEVGADARGALDRRKWRRKT